MQIKNGVLMNVDDFDLNEDGSFVIPKEVTIIGENAFSKSNLTHVKFHNNITKICKGAFYHCNTIENIVLPSSINEIDESAFKDCKNLSYIDLPYSITKINKGTFSGCENLISVNIPENVTELESECFYGCKSMYSINLPDNITKIGDEAFSMSGIESLTLPSKLKNMGARIVSNCEKLNEVTINSNLKQVDKNCFGTNDHEIKVFFKKNVTTIPKNMFENFDNRLHVDTYNVKTVEHSAFHAATYLNEFDFSCIENEIGPYAFAKTDINEADLRGTITKIGNHAFLGCTSLKTIYLPENLTELEDATFANCTNLTRVVLNDNLKIIHPHAFCVCPNLKSIIIPDSVEIIDRSVFSLCTNLTEIELSKNLKSLGSNAFTGCENLKKITIPEFVSVIDLSTFEECKNLNEVILPKQIIKIKDYAFSNCRNLEKIEIPSNVQCINQDAFRGCKKLQKITIPKGVKTIENEVFNGCTSLNEVTLHDDITSIGEKAFSFCESLEKITLPKDLKEIKGSAFSNCSNLKEIVIPNGVKDISYMGFENCSSLEKVVLHKDIKTIGNYAFSNCKNLSEISLPEGLTSIFDNAFSNCKNLKRIVLPNSIKNLGLNVFEGCSKEIEILFPVSEDKYKRINKENVNHFNGNCMNWCRKHPNEFIPSYVIFDNFPADKSENFYLNNNCKRWGNISKYIDNDNDKASLLKISYALGLFSEDVNTSKKAEKFVIENICEKMTPQEIHQRFDDLNFSDYNKKFAKLFMKYFPENRNFLVYERTKIDLISAVHNRMKDIEKVHPYSEVDADNNANELTPEKCINAILKTQYELEGNSIVKPGNEILADYSSAYGYNIETFNSLQKLHEEAKKIKPMLKIAEPEDITTEQIKYLASLKDAQITPFLGNLTNCCQTINGAGKECLKYGLTSENSTFMAIAKQGEENLPLAQAWVWYNEKEKTICLDNIEIPTIILDEIGKKEAGKELREEVFFAFARYVKDIANSTTEKGYPVEKVVTGSGYNDLIKTLVHATTDEEKAKMSIKSTEKPIALPYDYHGYTDAGEVQYILWEKGEDKKEKLFYSNKNKNEKGKEK